MEFQHSIIPAGRVGRPEEIASTIVASCRKQQRRVDLRYCEMLDHQFPRYRRDKGSGYLRTRKFRKLAALLHGLRYQYSFQARFILLYPNSAGVVGSVLVNRLRDSDLLELHRLFLWNGGII
jgi:hypothetical protein